MSVFSLTRLFGLLGILGGLAYLPARFFIVPAYDGSIKGLIGWGLDLTAITLSLFMLIGMLMVQMEKLKGSGITGFVLAFLGSVLMAGHQYGMLLLIPVVYPLIPEMFTMEPPLSFMVMTIGSIVIKMLGYLIFSIVTIRVNVLPRTAAILLIVGSIADFLPMGDYLSRIILGSGFIYMGSALWMRSVQRLPS
ncbi:MAG: hypothetical protein ACM32O_03705 [Clostridia bacterium]